MGNKLEKGCTFGLVLQNRVTNIESLMKDGFDRMDNSLDDIKKENKEMFNHMSTRPSIEAARSDKITWAIIGGLSSIIATLISMMIYGARVSAA